MPAPGALAGTRGAFDGAGRLLVDGTPRFVLGVLQRHGMMYLQTGNCFADGSWMRFGPGSFSISTQSYVQQFAQHPAALGYYIMDECVDSLIDETKQHYQQLKTCDPAGVVYGVTAAVYYRDPALWVNALDVMATDPYSLYGVEPPHGYPHFITADFTARLRAVARPDRPVWTVLQLFQFTTDSRLPTEQEMRSHAVMAIVERGRGCSGGISASTGSGSRAPPRCRPTWGI